MVPTSLEELRLGIPYDNKRPTNLVNYSVNLRKNGKSFIDTGMPASVSDFADFVGSLSFKGIPFLWHQALIKHMTAAEDALKKSKAGSAALSSGRRRRPHVASKAIIEHQKILHGWFKVAEGSQNSQTNSVNTG